MCDGDGDTNSIGSQMHKKFPENYSLEYFHFSKYHRNRIESEFNTFVIAAISGRREWNATQKIRSFNAPSPFEWVCTQIKISNSKRDEKREEKKEKNFEALAKM